MFPLPAKNCVELNSSIQTQPPKAINHIISETMESDERILSFIAEWFDPQPQIIKRYLLKYHVATNEVEMKDIPTKRSFLKKTKLPSTLKASDLYRGAKIVLLARELHLTEYADTNTRQLLESMDELTVCVVLPALYEYLGEIVTMMEGNGGGFTLVNMKSICLLQGRSGSDDEDILDAVSNMLNMEFNDIIQSPQPMVVMSFRGTNSIATVNALIQSSTFARGRGGQHANRLIACPADANEAIQYNNFFFTERHFTTTATLEECTCCVIKPHAVKERLVGSILHDIQSRGFVLSAVAMFRLERASAAEFLEVYDGGVFPEYSEMVDEMCSGSVVALEVRCKPSSAQLVLASSSSSSSSSSSTADNEDDHPTLGIVEKFRAHAGPWDVTMGE
jgi:nucleoside-diphosphate kinase